tara:strand:+ start:77051 stop:78037 length:987 start_codon:yes stop_codon:yes gene_type:complete
MLIRVPKGWEIKEREATPKDTFSQRRMLLKTLLSVPAVAAGTSFIASGKAVVAKENNDDPTSDLYPVIRNNRYKLDRPITPKEISTKYNNYYEFGSHKEIWSLTDNLSTRPWLVTIDGLVDKKIVIDIDSLIRQMPLEERVYRHRCVERWSMAVPYSGFPLSNLISLAKPLNSAKYIVMQSFFDADVAPGQRQFWYPWPYTEGLTIDEALNELAFIATGYYGEPIPNQNGAPLRLAVPWKYGFKHIKGIVRFTFSDKRPVSFWEEIAGSEYGFWANVAGSVPHPRWPQATEEFFGPNGKEKRRTQLYNGYSEYVSYLYRGLKGESLFK